MGLSKHTSSPASIPSYRNKELALNNMQELSPSGNNPYLKIIQEDPLSENETSFIAQAKG